MKEVERYTKAVEHKRGDGRAAGTVREQIAPTQELRLK
jgi:hypothetical protein